MPSVDELRQLARLRAEGVLSEERFVAEREQLLSSVPDALETDVAGAVPKAEPKDVGLSLLLVTLASIVAGVLTMLLFNVGLITGATVAVASLGFAAYQMHRDTEPED